MEAFEGFESRVRYDIVGHSGESKNILFVDQRNPPSDSKQRMETIKVSITLFEYMNSTIKNIKIYEICSFSPR